MIIQLSQHLLILWLLVGSGCQITNLQKDTNSESLGKPTATLKPGALRLDSYLPFLQGKRVGLVINQTSLVGSTHLADTLISLQINISAIFSPEHGFRGDKADGVSIKDGTDRKTGIPVYSLYGSNKRPSGEQMDKVDVIIYDIQDVGVRFYTYISTLHYVMEACAAQKKTLIVLDRPNPNSHYIDGPVLDTHFRSFVGMHPIPVVYALTPGELARMINGEKWLSHNLHCDLKVIQVENYSHGDTVALPIAPSPNLPTMQAVNLYPSLCLFEATPLSVGRGTPFPFQTIGFPDSSFGRFSFTPQPIANASVNPPQKGKQCFGVDLRKHHRQNTFNLSFLIEFQKKFDNPSDFFQRPEFFDKLAGTDKLRKQLMAGKSENEIRKSWQADLEQYKALRNKYLIYDDSKTKSQ